MATLAARGSGTPATTGTTWASVTNVVDGTAGTNPATYATMTSTTTGAVATITITGYGFDTTIGSADTLNSVSVSLRHFENNTGRFATVRFQAFDGATAIGTATTCTLATAARNDVATPAVTLAQLRSSTFKIVVTITGAASTQSRVFSIDQVDVTADYTPLPPAITQGAYRFYADGTETGSSALAAQDTGYTADTSGGDVNLQLRVRLQSTNAVAPGATDDWQLQWEKTPGTGSLADSYPDTNQNSGVTSQAVGGGQNQSFLGTGNALVRAGFLLRKAGAPAGNVQAVLYAHTGTFGTSSVGTGSPLATSTTTVSCASLPTSYAWQYFDFDESFTPTNGTPYLIGWRIDTGLSGGDTVGGGIDSTTPTHPGNLATNGTFWSSTPGSDLVFEVYTKTVTTGNVAASGGTVNAYNSANLTDAAATTNRLGAGSGSFVAGKISEDGLVDDLGWTANNYTELLYSITLKQADLAPADTVKFRVLRNGATTGLTYTQVPSITIGSAAPTDVTGTATGSITLAGSSSGIREMAGTATGSLTLTGAASGAPVTAPVLATATGTLTLSGTAAGVRPMTGTATGAITLAGTASGQKTVGATATAAVALTGAASGIKTVTATAVGTVTLTGAAVGAAVTPPVLGQAAGAVTVSSSTVGTRGTAGTATGTLTVAGVAAGTHGVTATATGALILTGTGSGQKTVTATAVAAITLAGTASGAKTVGATATGSLTIAGTAAGLREAAGTATGALTLAGTGVGQRTATATATGALELAGSASGQKSVTATAAGQITVTSSTLGLVEGNAVGIGNGAITLAGAATGVRDTKATATGALTVSGLASGTRGRPGVATAAITLTGLATGTKDVTATATGNISLGGTAVGAGVVSNVVGQWNTADVVAYQWGADEVVEWFMVTAVAAKTGTATSSLSLGGLATGTVFHPAVEGEAEGVITIIGNAAGTAVLLLEPFNNLTAWTVTGTPTIVSGRTGTAANFTGATNRADYTIPAASESDYLTVGFAFQVSSIASTRILASLRSDTGATQHNQIFVGTAGGIIVTRGATNVAISTNGLIVINTWYYLEVQTRLADSPNGSIVVRLNGAQIANTPGVDTKNAGTKTVYDAIRIGPAATSVTFLYDDLYVKAGAGAEFQGPISIS